MKNLKTMDDVITWLSQFETPYVALEGSRTIPSEVAAKMETIAIRLVSKIPSLIVRSGNAEGSDVSWAKGVNSVDPARLELYVPQKKVPKKHIVSGNRVITISDASYDHLNYAASLSCENYLSSDGRKKGKEAWEKLRSWHHNYLVRDVFKVTGVPQNTEKPIKTHLAILYIDPSKKNGGGTGHTKRICDALHVPVIEYNVWKDYL